MNTFSIEKFDNSFESFEQVNTNDLNQITSNYNKLLNITSPPVKMAQEPNNKPTNAPTQTKYPNQQTINLTGDIYKSSGKNDKVIVLGKVKYNGKLLDIEYNTTISGTLGSNATLMIKRGDSILWKSDAFNITKPSLDIPIKDKKPVNVNVNANDIIVLMISTNTDTAIMNVKNPILNLSIEEGLVNQVTPVPTNPALAPVVKKFGSISMGLLNAMEQYNTKITVADNLTNLMKSMVLVNKEIDLKEMKLGMMNIKNEKEGMIYSFDKPPAEYDIKYLSSKGSKEFNLISSAMLNIVYIDSIEKPSVNNMTLNLKNNIKSYKFSNERDDEYKLIVDYIKKNYKNIIIRDASLESEDIIYDENKTPKVVLYQNIKSNMRIKTNCPVLILSYNSDVYVEYIYDNTIKKDTVKSETAKSGEFNSPLMKYPLTDLINNKELLGTSLECTESSNVKMMTVENDVVKNSTLPIIDMKSKDPKVDFNILSIDPFLDITKLKDVNIMTGLLNIVNIVPNTKSDEGVTTFKLSSANSNNICTIVSNITKVKTDYYTAYCEFFKTYYAKYMRFLSPKLAKEVPKINLKLTNNELNILMLEDVTSNEINVITNGPLLILSLKSNVVINYNYNPNIITTKTLAEKIVPYSTKINIPTNIGNILDSLKDNIKYVKGLKLNNKFVSESDGIIQSESVASDINFLGIEKLTASTNMSSIAKLNMLYIGSVTKPGTIPMTITMNNNITGYDMKDIDPYYVVSLPIIENNKTIYTVFDKEKIKTPNEKIELNLMDIKRTPKILVFEDLNNNLNPVFIVRANCPVLFLSKNSNVIIKYTYDPSIPFTNASFKKLLPPFNHTISLEKMIEEALQVIINTKIPNFEIDMNDGDGIKGEKYRASDINYSNITKVLTNPRFISNSILNMLFVHGKDSNNMTFILNKNSNAYIARETDEKSYLPMEFNPYDILMGYIINNISDKKDIIKYNPTNLKKGEIINLAFNENTPNIHKIIVFDQIVSDKIIIKSNVPVLILSYNSTAKIDFTITNGMANTKVPNEDEKNAVTQFKKFASYNKNKSVDSNLSMFLDTMTKTNKTYDKIKEFKINQFQKSGNVEELNFKAPVGDINFFDLDKIKYTNNFNIISSSMINMVYVNELTNTTNTASSFHLEKNPNSYEFTDDNYNEYLLLLEFINNYIIRGENKYKMIRNNKSSVDVFMAGNLQIVFCLGIMNKEELNIVHNGPVLIVSIMSDVTINYLFDKNSSNINTTLTNADLDNIDKLIENKMKNNSPKPSPVTIHKESLGNKSEKSKSEMNKSEMNKSEKSKSEMNKSEKSKSEMNKSEMNKSEKSTTLKYNNSLSVSENVLDALEKYKDMDSELFIATKVFNDDIDAINKARKKPIVLKSVGDINFSDLVKLEDNIDVKVKGEVNMVFLGKFGKDNKKSMKLTFNNLENKYKPAKFDPYNGIVDYITKNNTDIKTFSGSLPKINYTVEKGKTSKIIMFDNVKSNDIKIQSSVPVFILSRGSDINVNFTHNKIIEKFEEVENDAWCMQFNIIIIVLLVLFGLFMWCNKKSSNN